MEAGNIREVCEHNSNVAWQANKHRDSQAWTALKLFFSEMADPAIVLSQGAFWDVDVNLFPFILCLVV
jgi:hypothetical protein